MGEAAKRNVGNGENQIPDMSFWTVTGGNGNFVIRQPDGLITQMVTVSISGPVAMNGMTDNAYAITGSNKSYIATATLPLYFLIRYWALSLWYQQQPMVVYPVILQVHTRRRFVLLPLSGGIIRLYSKSTNH